MRRISVFLLVLAAFTGLPFTSAVVLGGTVYVDDDNVSGPWDGTPEHPYRYIQDGIDGAGPLDTVYVLAGNYFENVLVHMGKPVCLMGEDRETTIIFPLEGRSGVYIDVDWVQVSGFTIRNTNAPAPFSAGIMISASVCMVSDNIVTLNTSHGIMIADTSDYDHLVENLISDNIISYNSWDGVAMLTERAEVTDNTVSNNVIRNNGLAGISMAVDQHSVISNNTIEDNQYGIVTSSPWTSHATITGNSIRYNKHGIWSDTLWGGAILNSEISGNIISGNDLHGLHVYAYDDTISDNVIVGNGASGVTLGYGSSGNAIGNNTIMNNGEAGISFDNVRDCRMFENYIAQNRYGIHLHHWATRNMVCENTIANNSDYGIYITNAFDDSIYHNDFVNNGMNAFNEDSAASNIWDAGYPNGGNCWSDYGGTDTLSGPGQNLPGGDGIGDTPYFIATCGQDGYPLLSGCTYLRGDANGDGIIDLGDLVYLIGYLYKGGPVPDPVWVGDCNCDEIVNLGDVVYLISYLYKGGPPPSCP
jgi:parallel beta-helix repeat protein